MYSFLHKYVLQYAYEYQEGKGGPGLDHIIFLNNLHLYFFVSKFTLPTPPPQNSHVAEQLLSSG